MILVERVSKTSLGVDNEIKLLDNNVVGIFIDIIGAPKIRLNLYQVKLLKMHLEGILDYYESKTNSESTT